MSRTHRLAWAAGFFDGEGFVTIGNRKSVVGGKTYTSTYLKIGINHVAIEPLIEMQLLLGGTIQKQNPKTVVGKRIPRHRWVCSTKSAANVLVQLMPYFKNKNKVAELGLEFQKTVTNKGIVKDDVLALRALIKEKIRALNLKD